AALFTVSCGIALLQVAANPYVAVIGPHESSESRLTLVQAFNTIGDVLAPLFGGILILARTTGGTSGEGAHLTYAQRIADARATELPYLIVAGVLAVLAVMIALAKLPDLGAATRRIVVEQSERLSLWRRAMVTLRDLAAHRNLVFGCGGILTCVWAEISVGNLFIS